MYTLFEHSHRSGAPVWNALAFEFLDQKNLLGVDRQFLLGRSVLVSPVLEKGASTVDAIFPPGIWFDYHTYKHIQGPKTVTLDAPTDGHMPLHIRGGHILPLQGSALTVAEARQTPFHLVVAFSRCGRSKGSLYIDDGTSLEVGLNFSSIKITANHTTISTQGYFGYNAIPDIQKITLVGLPSTHALVHKSNTVKFAEPIQANIATVIDGPFATVTLEGIRLPLNRPFTLQL
ncbi:hypothetical protein DSO57_1010615 [Entomophthora muscae]|uniref:Uncharacterized protein n=1 Tax=Entomophthora muscae TaxID=34485 RepID=A0ACC2RL74_9FUNG|nr:hypothetical protein DSO57_1010615 [Entomophthora muscae]